MLASQQAYIAYMRAGKTQELTALAKANDRASHDELNKLRAIPCNSECFDCSAAKPGWAVLPHGVFVCIDCAQQHRNLGRHISQTKAINTGTYLWYPAEIAVMREVGNAIASQALGANLVKPARDDPVDVKLAYCRAKYVDVDPDFVQAAMKNSTSSHPSQGPAPRFAENNQKTKPAALASARRHPTSSARDLIDLRDSVEREAPLTTAVGITTALVPHWTDELIVKPANAGTACVATSTTHEKKKADILARFRKHPSTPSGPKQELMSTGQLGADVHSEAFFATFGL